MCMATFRRAGEPSSATDSISGRDASQGTILLSQDVVSLVLEHIGGLRGLSDASRICRAFRDGTAAKSEEWRVLSVKGSFGTQGADRGMLFAPNFVLALQQGILVSDGSNCRLQLFSPTGASLWTIGSFGIGEESFHPRGTASDGKALWLADTNRHRVLRLSLSDGKLLASVGARGGGAGQLCFPTGLALAGATLAVTDTSNDRVVLLDAQAMRWRASFGQRGSAPGQFNHPCGCAVLPGADGAVQLLVADAFNHRLQLFTLGGGSSGRKVPPPPPLWCCGVRVVPSNEKHKKTMCF